MAPRAVADHRNSLSCLLLKPDELGRLPQPTADLIGMQSGTVFLQLFLSCALIWIVGLHFILAFSIGFSFAIFEMWCDAALDIGPDSSDIPVIRLDIKVHINSQSVRRLPLPRSSVDL